MASVQFLYRWLCGISVVIVLSACSSAPPEIGLTIENRYHDEQPALSGNGKMLVFISNRDRTQISFYDVENRRLVDTELRPKGIIESPSLSRTGRYLVYVASRAGRQEIILYDRITKQEKRLTSRSRLVRHPHISPDGRTVVFETVQQGQWDIAVIDRGPNVELDIADGSLSTPES